jgi:hypothetical protein
MEKTKFGGFGPLGVAKPPPWPMGGGSATQRAKREKQNLEGLGVAEPPPRAKTDLDLIFFFFFCQGVAKPPHRGCFGHSKPPPFWPKGWLNHPPYVFIFSIFNIINF